MQLGISDPTSGYRTLKENLPSPRENEYRAFAKCTAELSAAMKEGVPFSSLAAAIGRNRDLWRIVVLDVMNEKNRLSSELRANLIYLQEFTQHHSSKVLRGDASPNALIEINKSVMRGLRGDSGSDA